MPFCFLVRQPSVCSFGLSLLVVAGTPPSELKEAYHFASGVSLLFGFNIQQYRTWNHLTILLKDEMCFKDEIRLDDTHRQFPLDGLNKLLVCDMSLLASAFDLLWQIILVPETLLWHFRWEIWTDINWCREKRGFSFLTNLSSCFLQLREWSVGNPR